ncbi:MAG: hypothetical protein ABSA17_01960 [Rhabdochlamydiaceae bacterium]|jgi:hypothetical protein
MSSIGNGCILQRTLQRILIEPVEWTVSSHTLFELKATAVFENNIRASVYRGDNDELRSWRIQNRMRENPTMVFVTDGEVTAYQKIYARWLDNWKIVESKT